MAWICYINNSYKPMLDERGWLFGWGFGLAQRMGADVRVGGCCSMGFTQFFKGRTDTYGGK